jgi:isopentenyl-diphosphate delta-isomerase
MRMSPVLDRGLSLGTFWHQADTSLDDVVLVDDDDIAVGTMRKLQAHYLGRRHRAVSVLLYDRRGRLLLQRRASGKYHSAGLWTNTCCGHPRPGELVADAAIRRLQDEMGIGCELMPIFRMRYRVRVSGRMIENEITHVFGGCFEGEPAPNPCEVGDWRWAPMEQAAGELDRHPERFTAWFRRVRRLHWAKFESLAREQIDLVSRRRMSGMRRGGLD